MNQKLACAVLLVSTFLSNAQASTYPEFPGAAKIRAVVASNLKYIESEQVKENGSIYQAGEWPTHITSSLVPVAVGVGSAIGYDQEATPFTTGSVINALSSLYLEHPEMRETEGFQKIPQQIARGIPTFERYREGDLFNFYPPRMWKGVRVHQPADMNLIFAWKGFTNIPQDADTSSVVYSALLYNSRLNGQNYHVPDSALQSLQTFRDVNRKGHYYNRIEGRTETGAFMTWQFEEKNPDMPRFWFAPPQKGTRIPFNRNDVDCVVNLNVLRMLALNQTQNVDGRAQACSMINNMIKDTEHASCGIYYPNTFNLAYAVAKTSKAGENCISQDSKARTVDFILKLQSPDGGWDNDRNIWVDRVQSTAFAMTALLEFGDPNDYRVQSSLRYGTAFLMKSLKKSNDGNLYWKGETFFTATAIARGLIIWTSNSYTTALAANVLLKIAQLFP